VKLQENILSSFEFSIIQKNADTEGYFRTCKEEVVCVKEETSSEKLKKQTERFFKTKTIHTAR